MEIARLTQMGRARDEASKDRFEKSLHVPWVARLNLTGSGEVVVFVS